LTDEEIERVLMRVLKAGGRRDIDDRWGDNIKVLDPAKDALMRKSFSLANVEPTFSEDIGPSSNCVR